MIKKIQHKVEEFLNRHSEQFKHVSVMVIIDVILLIAILLVHGLLVTSCLKENLSDCPEEIRVYFDISTRTGDDIDPTNVDRMDFYVFDHKGKYLCEYIDPEIHHFDPDYYIDCSDLLPGKYRFVAWGGMDREFYSTEPVLFEKGKTTFNEALLMLNHSDEIVSKPVHHLFHSDLPVTVSTSRIQHFLMPLTQQTNTIEIRTLGFRTESERNYIFVIEDNDCTYQFDAVFAKCSQKKFNLSEEPDNFKYETTCIKDASKQLHATLNVVRLAYNRHRPQLRLYDQTADVILYPAGGQSGDLIDLIIRAIPDNNFDTTNHYEIVLTFTDSGEGYPTRLPVTIHINGWELKEESNIIE